MGSPNLLYNISTSGSFSKVILTKLGALRELPSRGKRHVCLRIVACMFAKKFLKLWNRTAFVTDEDPISNHDYKLPLGGTARRFGAGQTYFGIRP